MLGNLRARMNLLIEGVHEYQTNSKSFGLTRQDKEKRWRMLCKYTSAVMRARHHELVMQDMLKEKDDVTFFWLAQMRHHYVPNRTKNRSVPGTVAIRIFGVSVDHGGEMFGAKSASSIVITPLTERCYRAILLSLSTRGAHGGSGAVLNGPSGMGNRNLKNVVANVWCCVPCLEWQ